MVLKYRYIRLRKSYMKITYISFFFKLKEVIFNTEDDINVGILFYVLIQ